jgi:potassium efflux system protein
MLKATGGWGDVSQLSLGDVVTALLVAVLGIIATKNLPQMLDFTVIRNLSLDAGARYAVLTLARYTTATVGALAVFQVLGVSWGSVQWLVAAVGVGLGFGLQEIFANFVSGIILLFERPVRVGDMVTIGDITGNVSKIRIRSTTIVDFELRELVVPNKELITNRIINWTLSDTVSRMTVHVGVAYGSDPDKVRALLLGVAERHPLVLKEPKPHALLDEFGASALQFILRVYMSSRNVYLDLRHELLTQIAEELAKEDITIPYPHQDIRIEGFAPLQRA